MVIMRGPPLGHGGAYGGGMSCIGLSTAVSSGMWSPWRPLMSGLGSGQAMVRSEGDWGAIFSFYEADMLAKEEAGRSHALAIARDTPGIGDRVTIFGHRK